VAAGISATDLIDPGALVLDRSDCPLFIVSQIGPNASHQKRRLESGFVEGDHLDTERRLRGISGSFGV
jgi:hypothetical protein